MQRRRFGIEWDTTVRPAAQWNRTWKVKMTKSREQDVPSAAKVVIGSRKAHRVYRSTRGRAGLHDFLETLYKTYWAIRRASGLNERKKVLKRAAGLTTGANLRLSELLLNVASADIDRRDRHRWKSLIETAYLRRIEPHRLKRELIAMHGVNRALAQWKNAPLPAPIFYPEQPSSDEIGRSPNLDIPLLVDDDVADADNLSPPAGSGAQVSLECEGHYQAVIVSGVKSLFASWRRIEKTQGIRPKGPLRVERTGYKIDQPEAPRPKIESMDSGAPQ